MIVEVKRHSFSTWPNHRRAQWAFRRAKKLRGRGWKRLKLYTAFVFTHGKVPTDQCCHGCDEATRWVVRARRYFYAANCYEQHGVKMMLGMKLKRHSRREET